MNAHEHQYAEEHPAMLEAMEAVGAVVSIIAFVVVVCLIVFYP
jgi:hypothetical protein